MGSGEAWILEPVPALDIGSETASQEAQLFRAQDVVERLYMGISDKPEIRIFEYGKGLTEVIRWARRPRDITAADRRAYEEKREWLISTFPPVAPTLLSLSEYPDLPRTLPLFLAIRIDDRANIWVRHYPEFVAGRPDLFDIDIPRKYSPPGGAVREEWTVFDSTGRWLGDVRTPAGLAVKSIQGDRILEAYGKT